MDENLSWLHMTTAEREQAGIGVDLLHDVELHLARYIAYPGEAERVAHTLWVAHAHHLDAFESTPRLAFLSPEPGSGKTRALEVTDTLVPGPMHVLSASPAALFRSLAKGRRTLLLDEVDAIFGRRGKDENNEDLRALLNAGHRAGATIPRCVGPTHDVTEFEVYAAVALAGLGDLPDTLMSRSVVIRMRRRAAGEQVRPFRARFDVEPGHELRDRLAAWVANNANLLEQIPIMPPGVDDRPADVWEPLLAVADAAGGPWPERARLACQALVNATTSREASLGIRLLTDLKEIFGGHETLPTATILTALTALDEAPWAELKGKPLDARGLAWRLSQYGIKSKNIKQHDESVLKGYTAEDLHDAWARYVPEDDDHPGVGEGATSATGATSPVVLTQVAGVADVADLRTPEEADDYFQTVIGGAP